MNQLVDFLRAVMDLPDRRHFLGIYQTDFDALTPAELSARIRDVDVLAHVLDLRARVAVWKSIATDRARAIAEGTL